MQKERLGICRKIKDEVFLVGQTTQELSGVRRTFLAAWSVLETVSRRAEELMGFLL